MNSDCIATISLIFTVISTLILILISVFGPKRLMFRQMLLDLMKEYRSTDIGEAVISMINFYENDCSSEIKNIEEQYIKIFKKEIGLNKLKENIDFRKTLHFKRRLLSQFYNQIAYLRFRGSLFTMIRKGDLKQYFTSSEAKMIALLYEIENKALPKIEREFKINILKGKSMKNNTNDFMKLLNESKEWN